VVAYFKENFRDLPAGQDQ